MRRSAQTSAVLENVEEETYTYPTQLAEPVNSAAVGLYDQALRVDVGQYVLRDFSCQRASRGADASRLFSYGGCDYSWLVAEQPPPLQVGDSRRRKPRTRRFGPNRAS